MPPDPQQPAFSFRTRAQSLKRLQEETFDLLVIGGGITGTAVARDAVLRGLKVALVEKRDFAFGTSSRSSKLIHGGLRYLEKFEFSLVFEALKERALLLRTMPTLVRPLPFYFPVYRKDRPGKLILGLGMWFYDLLSLFRAPGFHRSLSKRGFLREVPALNPEGLRGGYRYYDASMWDDVIAVEVARAAQASGACLVSYCEALEPVWSGGQPGAGAIHGFRVRDREPEALGGSPAPEFTVKAKRVAICLGPYTDLLGPKLSRDWKPRLSPSKGVHLVFDLRRLPVPGALVMSNPGDGRIAFVMPRPDYGTGVTIVGTTDGPVGADPDRADVEASEVRYLLGLLRRYFPSLELTDSDILSAYVGVRPLVAPGGTDSSGQDATALQKVSREHHIEEGPGQVIWVAGGKYTTHRTMAAEIVDTVVARWKEHAERNEAPPMPALQADFDTEAPPSLEFTAERTNTAKAQAERQGLKVPQPLWERFGADALSVAEIQSKHPNLSGLSDPPGFPYLEAQLRHQIRNGMVMHLSDFYFRRSALFLARADHGLPWLEGLSKVWAEERGLGVEAAARERARTEAQLVERVRWTQSLRAVSA
jgi:glycerol-3-phosphate dehydrogenase